MADDGDEIDWRPRVNRLEHAIFGFQRREDGVWIDGILQQMSDIRNMNRLLGLAVVRVGLPLLGIIAAAVVASAAHNYGFAESAGHVIKGMSTP